jgi:2-haloacid dehalogenase
MPIKAIVFDAYGTLYDVQSVALVTDQAFPGYGELITQIWRIKQLEYTWLRSLMGRYKDFWAITQDSLAYTIDCLGLKHDDRIFDQIMDKYCHLDLYPEARQAIAALGDYKLAILSNGSPAMLNALVHNSGLEKVLDATISVDAVKIFKPSAQAYGLIEATLGASPQDVLFVSSNAFDACGAKSFGLNVAWIERVSAPALAHELENNQALPPFTMFKAIRMRMEQFELEADHRIQSLAELPKLFRSGTVMSL